MTSPKEQVAVASDYERDLIARLKEATAKKDEAEAIADKAKEEFNKIEAEARQYMQDSDLKKTGEIVGLGWITLADQKLSASIEEGRSDDVLEYVRSIGREDLIKTSINSQTLASFVGQCLKDNHPLPPHVNFFRPQKARFYPSK